MRLKPVAYYDVRSALCLPFRPTTSHHILVLMILVQCDRWKLYTAKTLWSIAKVSVSVKDRLQDSAQHNVPMMLVVHSAEIPSQASTSACTQSKSVDANCQ